MEMVTVLLVAQVVLAILWSLLILNFYKFMYKPLELKVTSFYGGISDDPRKVSANEFQITKHFDIFSQPNRLIPYRSLETDTNDGSSGTGMKQYSVRDFLYPSASEKLYGLGQTAGGLTQIFQKADATTGNWSVPASSTGDGVVKNGCFVEYKDYVWGFQGTTQVFKWGALSGTPAITNSAGTVGTITSVAQGLIGKDDNLYLPYNNKLARVTSGGTVNDAVLTLPTDLKITSLARYGNYLAIGCSPISTFNGKSVVFLWNYTSTDVQETIDWGEGELRVLENIEGSLVGVTDRYLNNSSGAGRGSMIIQLYQGGVPQVVKEVFTQKLTAQAIPLSKAVKNNRVFFAAKIFTNTAGTEYNEGIWSFGRKNVNYPYTLTLDIIDQNVSTSGIQAFGTAANFFFIAHSADGSIDKTDDTATYAFTSIYESQLFSFGDPTLTKQLLQFTIYTSPLPTSGSVTVKYKVDGATSWTTLGTLTTVGAISRDFLSIESTDTPYATFKEVQFRIESVTGGAEITGFKIMVQPLSGSN